MNYQEIQEKIKQREAERSEKLNKLNNLYSFLDNNLPNDSEKLKEYCLSIINNKIKVEKKAPNFYKTYLEVRKSFEVMQNGDMEYSIIKQEGPCAREVPAYQCRKCKNLFEAKLGSCNFCDEKFEIKTNWLKKVFK